MRRNMTLKLCPLLSLLFSVVGCGKKMDGASSSSEIIAPHQEISPRLTLELDTAKNRAYSYTMPKDGNITQPDKLKVASGNMSGKSVMIYYSVSPTDSTDYVFKCQYTLSNSVPNVLDIKTCYDPSNYDIGNFTDNNIPIESGYKIRMELVGSLTGPVVVDAFYSVAWK
jgi:hypothetical protein